MEYDFEKSLRENKMDTSIVDARRFAQAVRAALRDLEREARCYKLTDQDYYLETKAFLEKQLTRLEADNEAVRERAARAEKTAQDVSEELTEAKRQIDVGADALEKTNKALCKTICERDALREWADLPAWKRLFVKPPVFEESKE